MTEFVSSPDSRTDYPTPAADESPTAVTASGPVWIVDGSEGAPMRVRQLPAATGLLALGATLRHTGACGHPRLQSPTLWWRDRDRTWVAAPRCEGTSLATDHPPRMTWSTAVDLLTPLALGLKTAHRRGLVHANLAPWNVYYDETTERLTAVDFGTWPVDTIEAGPFCPPEMLSDADSSKPIPATDIHNLARLLISLALSPQQARRDRPNFETLPGYAIATLERAIDPDPAARPQTIDEFLSGLTFRRSTSEPATEDQASICGRVQGFETFEHERHGPGLRFHLHSLDEDQAFGVFVYKERHPAVYDSLSLVWEGAELNLVAPRTIEDSKGRTFLTATEHTLPVIEPFWPISVSNVLKAQGCPQRVMVDMRDGGERTHHLAFGTLVHQFLEDLTADPTLSFEDALQARLPRLRLDFLASGVDDAQLAKLSEDARSHFEHLRRFTARRTDQAGDRDRVGWVGEHAEATRYSTRFGLEGRSDLVVTDPDEGLQIIELKSGKPWHDHAGQVQSYALLWRMLADRKQMATTGHLLYSKNGRMKEVSLGGGDQKSLIHGRNGLIAMFRSFVDPTYTFRAPHFMEEPQLCRENACRFRRDRCKAQTRLLGLSIDDDGASAWRGVDADLMHRCRRYNDHLTRLIEMERWSDHAALGAIFQPHRLPERVADGIAAAELRLSPPEQVTEGDDRALLAGKNLHIFSAGDRILLHRGDVDGHHVFRATVIGRPEPNTDDKDSSTTGEQLLVRLRAASLSDQFCGPGWIADKAPARIGYRTAHRAVHRIVDNRRSDLLGALLRPAQIQDGDENKEITGKQEVFDAGDRPLHEATEKLLNESQLDALYRGLQRRPATLIQGPPGTGKTTVIAHLCAELADRDQTVLLSALTNTAVDTMLVKLLEAADARGQYPPPFLRLGPARRSPLLAGELEKRDLDPTNYFADDLCEKVSSLTELDEHLSAISVVATTAHSALRHSAITYFERRRKKPAFDVALVDEASQLTEPMALAPISTARRFVLVGDHRQLPPIVTSERALTAFITGTDDLARNDHTEPEVDENDKNDAIGENDKSGAPGKPGDDSQHRTTSFPVPPLLRDAGLGGLDRSLFERLAKFIEPRMLTTQYRMHRHIMAFPAAAFYDDRLQAHPSVSGHSLDFMSPPGVAALSNEASVVFVDVDGAELGRTNPDEARAVLETTAALARSAPDATVGVISPFRAQVHLLRRLHRQKELDVDVDTVERFQGNERDVICATLVKTDHPGDFLADVRRLNVALTRAKKKLIIFGHRECLERDPTFRQWIESAQTNIEVWEDKGSN